MKNAQFEGTRYTLIKADGNLTRTSQSNKKTTTDNVRYKFWYINLLCKQREMTNSRLCGEGGHTTVYF